MKKFLLVPPSTQSSPLMQKLSKLDEEMKGVLDRRDLDDFSKATAYSQVLGRYLGVKEQLDMPTPIPLVEETSMKTQHRVSPSIPSSPIINSDRIKSDDIHVTLFPKSLRNRALHLLNHIRKQQDMSWNERGDLVIDDKPIFGTHIVDLVDNVIRGNHKRPDPPGVDTFVQALQKSNVPQSLMGNKDRFIAQDRKAREPDQPTRNPQRSKSAERYTRSTRLPRRAKSYDRYTKPIPPRWEKF